MRKDLLDQFDRGARGGIPGDDGQITANTLTQWEQLSTLRERKQVMGDFSYHVTTQIRPLEHQYLLLIQHRPEEVREQLQEQRQKIIASTGTPPSRARLCARFLDEQVGT